MVSAAHQTAQEACIPTHCEIVQALAEQADGSELLGRVSKQAHALESIAKAFPLTDPQVGYQSWPSASARSYLTECADPFYCTDSCRKWANKPDVQDERMQDMMVDMRGKYKAICARLGIPEQLHLAAQMLSVGVAVRPSYDF